MHSRICTHRFDRVPSVIPRRRPAVPGPEHGVPPVTMSTFGTDAQSIAVMSPRFGTPGQCASSTRDGAASYSANHADSAPKNSSTARSSPPYPEQSEPIVSLLTAAPPPT